MAVAFSETNMITCIHKHYSLEQWSQFDEEHPDALRNVAVSCGTSDSDFEKLQDVMAKVNVPFVCIDVANGYSEYVRQSELIFILLYVIIILAVRGAC